MIHVPNTPIILAVAYILIGIGVYKNAGHRLASPWAPIGVLCWPLLTAVGVFALFLIPLVGMSVIGAVEGGIAELQMHDQHSNHARFEGTWTPRELRLEQARRELDAFRAADVNHARVEGARV